MKKENSPWYVLKAFKPKGNDPFWWLLKWKPIKGMTWNIHPFRARFLPRIRLGFGHKNGNHIGYHRGYDRIDFEISCFTIGVAFWLKYNFYCHRNGASDFNFGSIELPKVKK